MDRQGFPIVGEELVDLRIGVCGDTGKQIAQIGERIQFVLLGTLDQAVVDSGGPTSALAAGEKIILASHHDVA